MRIGTPAKRRSRDTKLSAARVAAARRSAWVEIQDDLVERDGGRVFVSASTDAAFTRARGTLFETGSTRLVAAHAALYFVVRGDELIVFERMPSTWSDQVGRRGAELVARL